MRLCLPLFVFSLVQISKEFSIFTRMYINNINRALLMKVKWSHNRLYKVLMETRQPTLAMTCKTCAHKFSGTQNDGKEDGYGTIQNHTLEPVMWKLYSLQTRKTVVPSSNQFPRWATLQLVHVDLWDLITSLPMSSNKYFLLLVDNYSPWILVYMLKEKEEALCAFKKFKRLVENGSGYKLKNVRTNRGGEFLS